MLSFISYQLSVIDGNGYGNGGGNGIVVSSKLDPRVNRERIVATSWLLSVTDINLYVFKSTGIRALVI